MSTATSELERSDLTDPGVRPSHDEMFVREVVSHDGKSVAAERSVK